MTEFDIIKKYFTTQTQHRGDVIHGIGDDAAIVSIPLAHELVITTDTLINGVHFPTTTSAFDIGYKSLAVNLSDLAAMGAKPAWVTLALTIPSPNENWIREFSDGFFTLANRYQVQLIGGDLTHGPLAITAQVMGFVPTGRSIMRSQAKIGDLIYVTGTVGDAALGLAFIKNEIELHENDAAVLEERLNRPEPRLAIGERLLELAHAAIDISDGLAADLGHILTASDVGATIYVDRLPLSQNLKKVVSVEKAITLALTGGDDYEICFTMPPEKRTLLERDSLHSQCTCIGEITAQPGLNLYYDNGKKYYGAVAGYQHF